MRRQLVLITMLMVLVAGCVAPIVTPAPEKAPAAPAPEEAPATPVPQPVTLRYFMWDPDIEDLERELITRYEAEHPNVKVELEALAFGDYWPKLSALAAAQQMPDVFAMSSGFVDEWATNGLLEDLQPYVDRDIQADEYFTSAFNPMRYPDKATGDMYAFPFAWVVTVLYYNKDAFDEAGVAYPTSDWTWDDFLEAAKKLTVDKDGDGVIDQWGYWFYGRYANVEPWIYQNNGRLLNPQKTRFEPNEGAIEALQFLYDLIYVHKVAPMPKEMEGIRAKDVFPMGMAAMWIDGSWNIGNNRKVVGDSFNWGLATIPRGPHWEKDVAYGWSDALAISPAGQKDQAWEFIKFMTGPAREARLFKGGKVPIYKAVAFSEEWLEKGQQPDNKDLILKWGEHIGRNSFTPGWGEWRGRVGGAGLQAWLDAAFNGESDLDTALQEAGKKANEVLTRYYPTP